MLTRTMLIVAIVLLGRAEAFTGSLCVPSILQRMVVLGADADPTTVDSNESLVDKAYAACRVVRGVKNVDKNLDVLCSTLAPEPRYRWQRENLECDIIPGGLRDTSSPRRGLLFACEEARNGRDVEKRAGVKALIEALEAVNPTERPLEHPDLLSGTWRLVYTTSDSILGTNRPRALRPKYRRILQSINAETLEAKNEEWVLQGLLKNSVKASLVPKGDDGRTVTVQFKRFGVGWLRFPAPKSAVGILETTYLDDELRVSRGDKGNLFVLVKQGPPRV